MRRLPPLLALVALLTFLPTLSAGFVWDDVDIVSESASLDRVPLSRALIENRWNPYDRAIYFRPVVYLTHRLDLAVWGHDPAGHHLTNVLIYAALVWLLAALALELQIAPAGVAVAVGLFAVHPAHVEPVAWVSGRSDLLAGAFGLGWLLLARRGAPLPLTWGCLFFALCSKETAVVFPLAAVFLLPWRTLARAALPAVALWFSLRLACLGVNRAYPFGPPRSVEELAFLVALNLKLAGRYLAMLATGVTWGPLGFDEMMTVRAQVPRTMAGHALAELDVHFVLACAAVAGLAPALVRRFRADPRDRFALALGVGAMGIAMNLWSTNMQIVFSDRYLFLPSAGAALLLAGAVARLEGRARTAVLAGAVLLAVTWIGVAQTRFGAYANLIAFLESAVERAPRSARAWRTLGLSLRPTDPDEALRALEQAWRLTGRRQELTTLLTAQVTLGYDREALATIAEHRRSYPRAMLDRETLAMAAGAAARARVFPTGLALADQALALGQSEDAENARALCLAGLGRVNEASAALRALAAREPREPTAWHNLAVILARAARTAEARAALDEARRAGVPAEALARAQALVDAP